MDKLNFEFFDFFGATLPGVPTLIMICFITGHTPFSYDAIHLFLKNTSVNESIIIVFICYAIGFCFHYPAYGIFQFLVKLWGKKRTLGLDISIGKREGELVKIRKNSLENFKLISKFLALRQMAYTMMFSLLIFSILLIIQSIISKNWTFEVCSTLFLALLFGFLFLRRSVAFHQRIQEMITEAANP